MNPTTTWLSEQYRSNSAEVYWQSFPLDPNWFEDKILRCNDLSISPSKYPSPIPFFLNLYKRFRALICFKFKFKQHGNINRRLCIKLSCTREVRKSKQIYHKDCSVTSSLRTIHRDIHRGFSIILNRGARNTLIDHDRLFRCYYTALKGDSILEAAHNSVWLGSGGWINEPFVTRCVTLGRQPT